MIISQTALSSAYWLLWFIPVSIQVGSAMGSIATAVQVGSLPHLDPSVYGASVEISPTPFQWAAGAATGIGAGTFGGSTLQGLVAPFLEMVGWCRVLLCYKTGMPLRQRGSFAMAEVGQWNTFSTYTFRREVLTMICFSFLRGSTGRSAVYMARTYCSIGCISFCPLPELGPKC